MFVIAFGAAFVLTWLFGYKDTNVSEKTESVEAVGDKSTTEKAMQMILCFIVYQKELRFCFPR